jgi:hypothetical protein
VTVKNKFGKTFQINSNHDDDGLMVGRYDGEYKDGVAPHAWTGSVAILERYLTDGGRPVEYGQCWVFSGLVVTICRALGNLYIITSHMNNITKDGLNAIKCNISRKI